MSKLISLIKIIWNNPDLIKKGKNEDEDWWYQCFTRENKRSKELEKERDEMSQRLIDNNIDHFNPYQKDLEKVRQELDDQKSWNDELGKMWEAEQEPLLEIKDKYIKLLAAVKVLDINIEEKI